MSLSYSALTNYGSGKVTLPSIDSWGTNMNILRDPPKSITTRRINKVGETSSITQMIDDSDNRACEAILHYARGQNPSVSVSYNNSGQGSCNPNMNMNAGKQAFLPYRIMNGGAFRPPLLRQENTMPLSRLPRPWTNAFTKAGFVDFSKRMRNCGTAETTKEVKNNLLKVCARPTAVYKIETPLTEPMEVKYNIQNSINVSGTSGIRTMDLTTQNVKKPTKGAENDLHAYAQSNINQDIYKNESTFHPDRYLQEAPNNNVRTNLGQPNLQLSSIDEILDLSGIKVQDILQMPYSTQLKGYEKNNYIHDDLRLSRKLPENISARTNLGENIYKSIEYENSIELDRTMPLATYSCNLSMPRIGTEEIISREYKLAPKINAGGYDARGSMPMEYTEQNIFIPDSEKSMLNKRINQQFQRYHIPTSITSF